MAYHGQARGPAQHHASALAAKAVARAVNSQRRQPSGRFIRDNWLSNRRFQIIRRYRSPCAHRRPGPQAHRHQPWTMACPSGNANAAQRGVLITNAGWYKPLGAHLRVQFPPEARHDFRQGARVGVAGAEIGDAGAQQEPAVDHGVGQKRLAAPLDADNQPRVQVVQVIFRRARRRGIEPGGNEAEGIDAQILGRGFDLRVRVQIAAERAGQRQVAFDHGGVVRPARPAQRQPDLERHDRPDTRNDHQPPRQLIPDLDNKDPFDGSRRASRAGAARCGVIGQASKRSREALLPHRRPRSFVRWLRSGPLVVRAPQSFTGRGRGPRLTSGQKIGGQMGLYYRDLVLYHSARLETHVGDSQRGETLNLCGEQD